MNFHLQNFQLYNKSDWSLRKQLILFPSNLNIDILGKQNQLFLWRSVIKLLVNQFVTKILFFSLNRSLYGPTRDVCRRCQEVCHPKAKSCSPSQWKPEANRFCYYKETCLQFGIHWLFGFKILLQYDRGFFCCHIVVPLDMIENWKNKIVVKYFKKLFFRSVSFSSFMFVSLGGQD